MTIHGGDMLGKIRNKYSRVFLGGLSERTNKKDIARIFSKYGSAKRIWISVRPPWIALVHFEDENGARRAFRRFNGTLVLMKKRRVRINLPTEFPKHQSGKIKIYVEGLGEWADKRKFLEASESFGNVRQIWVARQQSSIALIYFEHSREALRAVRHVDGRLMNFTPIAAQLARVKSSTLIQEESTKVCVSDLGEEADEMEIEETFMAFGTLKYLWVSRPSKIANVFFENDRDAREAVRCLDGTLMNGRRVNVELDRERTIHRRRQFNRRRNTCARVRVSGLDKEVDKSKIERTFKYFGRINHIWIARQPPWIAYVFFDDDRDAKEASRCLDGSFMGGKRIKVTPVKPEMKSDTIKKLKVYVSGFGEGADEPYIEKVFGNFGRVKQVWVARQQPGIATVYFVDAREALEAINHLDGTRLNGNQIKVRLVMETPIKSKWESTRVLLEGLGEGADKGEIERAFKAYGRIKYVWVSREPFGTACVFFEKMEDAEKAMSHLDRTYMNGMRIKVTVPTGKRDWLIWKVNSATETKMDFNKKDDDNLPSNDKLTSSKALCCTSITSSSEGWAYKSSQQIKNDYSQECVSLFEEISRIKHLVNLEKRPAIDKNIKRGVNKRFKIIANKKGNDKNNNNKRASKKRRVFVNSFLKREISSVLEKSRKEQNRISSKNVDFEKRNFVGTSETSSIPVETLVTTTGLPESTSIIYIVNNYHHHYYQLQDPVDEGSLCLMDATDSSIKNNAVQDISFPS